MIFYLVSMIHAFVPEAFLFGLLLSRTERRSGLSWHDAWTVLAGFAGAFVVQRFAPSFHATTQMGVILPAIAVGLCLLLGAALVLPAAGRAAALRFLMPAVLFLLCLQAMADFLARTTDHSMSSTAVVNTELILNIGMMTVGAGLLFAVFLLSWQAARRLGNGAVWLALAALVLAVALWGTQVSLGLLQLGSIDATGGRLTLVAKLTQLVPFAPYAQIVLLGVLIGLSYARRPRRQDDAGTDSAALRRKQMVRVLIERRWRWSFAVATAVLLAAMLYNDLYASLPPRLSPAVEMKPDSAGQIRIKVDDVRDGILHRYAYISADGHRVRFFLINRYDPAHTQIGVVYDACKLCGDLGYVQRGNEVICIACNVRMFLPSIGKPGGCNPIPLPHEEADDTIIIAAAELERGARYFTETVDIKVSDPVTGAPLLNRTAPFKYDYKGRMFYFENQGSYDAFRESPAKYAPDAS